MSLCVVPCFAHKDGTDGTGRTKSSLWKLSLPRLQRSISVSTMEVFEQQKALELSASPWPNCFCRTCRIQKPTFCILLP